MAEEFDWARAVWIHGSAELVLEMAPATARVLELGSSRLELGVVVLRGLRSGDGGRA